MIAAAALRAQTATAVWIGALGALLIVAAAALAGQPVLLPVLVCGVVALGLTVFRPELTAISWLLLCPLIVGIARGEGLLVMRPNEVLLLVIAASLALRMLWDDHTGALVLPELRKTDGAILCLLLCGSVFPLLIGYGRGTAFTKDDLLYSMVFVKYALLYSVFRFAVRTEGQLKACLTAILVSATLVALVALLQARDLLGVPQLLSTYYDSPFEGSVGASSLRASSTIASAFGLGDVMAMCLAIAIILAFKSDSRMRLPLAALALLFLGGGIASGSFSSVIGCTVVIIAVGTLVGRLAQLLMIAVPFAAVSAMFLWTTIAARLEGFSSYRSLPKSWIGRLDNLERFFWPELFSGWNWLLGVRPAGRIAASESWREYIYIESGYTWLLWTGGVPLALAFVYLVWSVSCDLLPKRPQVCDAADTAAKAALAATAMLVVLMIFDPHLTVRGTADLYFPLLALALFRPLAAPAGAAEVPPIQAGAMRSAGIS